MQVYFIVLLLCKYPLSKILAMKLIRVIISKLFPVFIFLSLPSIKISAQGFAWAEGIAGFDAISVLSGTTDENNNGYFVGTFNGTADFDPGPGVQNLIAVGDQNMFILKKDAAGNFLWVKPVTGININTVLCFGYGIGLDGSGNIYIGGFFQGDFDFDPGPGIYPLSSNGGTHSFVLKLDPTGNFIWVKDMGNQSDVANVSMASMKLDADNNIFFACYISGSLTANTIDVDPGPAVYNIICPTTSGPDGLIEKLDSAGNFIWAKQISGNNGIAPLALALDTLSNVYITGQFRGTADFDPGVGTADLTATNNYDAFIAKYDSAGNHLWAEQISGGGLQSGYGVATDTFGGVVVTGLYEATADFDPSTGVYNMTAPDLDMFVLKLRADGSFAWANSAPSFGNNSPHGIATDGLGNVYSTGDFFGGGDFDPGPGEYWLDEGVYVQKLDSAGNFVWARDFDGEVPSTIILDHANDIYVVGRYGAPGDFDPGPSVLTLNGSDAGFIEKLCGASLAITASDSTPCAGDNVLLTATAIMGATYTWTRNDTVIAGSSNTITISQPGVYEVYTDGGCPNASGPIYIIDCTGVGETMEAAGVEVYPNPAQDELTIKTNFNNYTLTILNTLGQVVERGAKSGSVVMDVSRYNAGVYYIQIETGNGHLVTGKFVVGH